MTDKPLADVWISRDFPVLTEATRRLDAGDHLVSIQDLAGALSMSLDDVRRSLNALERRGFVSCTWTMGNSGWVDEVTGEAYILTGLHPDGDDALERLISVLRQAAEQTSDPEEKGQLKKAANALGGLVGSVGSGVLTAYLTGMLPGQ
jgi:DNA-binding transcriptional regulator YhcF (GntR family)